MPDNHAADICSKVIHGGDIYRNHVSLDYSVNLNPETIPEEIEKAALEGLSRKHQYPDPLQIALRSSIAGMEGIEIEDVICGSGASEIMMAIVHAMKPKNALITAPCYAGYRWALGAEDARITEYALDQESDFVLDRGILEKIDPDTDILFIANPNNPNGKLIEPELLLSICDKCRSCGTVLVIDECFLPLTNRYHEKTDLDDGAIHVRAFTKTFAIPGIRLGYMLCGNAGWNQMIRKHLPEWNVSATAGSIGVAAAKIMRDTDFLKRSVKLIEQERSYLIKELTACGIKVYPSDTNYLLLRAETDLYEALLAQGILIRRCANFSGLGEHHFRIAVREHEDNLILVSAVRQVLAAERG